MRLLCGDCAECYRPSEAVVRCAGMDVCTLGVCEVTGDWVCVNDDADEIECAEWRLR